MNALINEIAGDPSVGPLLTPVDPIISPARLIGAALQADGFESVTQAEIDSVRNIPQIQGALAAMTGSDTDGGPVAIANISLMDTGDERVQDAERRINELAVGDEGPLRVSSLSPTIYEDEYREATESGMAPLIGLALLLIAALLLLFTRALSDMLLTLTGLVLSIVWVVGAEGWLGPNGLSLIGPPSSLTVIVPVIIISLTVDYAIQAISHYRERRIAGEPVVEAVRQGLRNVAIPLTLAAVTHDSQPFGDLVLADWRDRRLRRCRWTGRGNEPGSDAHADSGRSDYYRPATRGSGRFGSASPHLQRAARHHGGGGVALGRWVTRLARALPHRRDSRHDSAWVRRHRAEVRVQHPRHPAPRRERDE